MKEKRNSTKSATRFVVINIAIAVLVTVILFTCVTLWLKGYTLHGQEVTIPQITGLSQEEAEMVLACD